MATTTVKVVNSPKPAAKAAKPVAQAVVKAAPKAAKVRVESTKPATPAVAKPVEKALAQPVARPPVKALPAKAEKVKKPKLVRDSFNIPKGEYVVLDALKARAAKLAQPAKKSELLRAGIKALAAMNDAALKAALQAVPAIKTGRPKN